MDCSYLLILHIIVCEACLFILMLLVTTSAEYKFQQLIVFSFMYPLLE